MMIFPVFAGMAGNVRLDPAGNGVHPKVAQAIMRHSDINLTMSRYTHIFRGQEAAAIAKLPDLSAPDRQKQKATGTDGKCVDVQSDLAFLGAGRCSPMQSRAGATPTGAIKSADSKANGRIRTDNPWFTKPKGKSAKSLTDKPLTDSPEYDLASFLAQIVQEHPDLAKLIEAWPALGAELRAAIVRMVGQ